MRALRRLVLLAAVLTAVAVAAGSAAAAPSLRVVGNRLVDTSTGGTFVPRGVNWPSFEYACFYGYGNSNEASSTSVGPTAAQARLIASWHANIVRVPLNQDCWLGDDGQPSGGFTVAGYRAAVAAWVAKLHAAGLAVILDLHWSGPDGVPAEGQRMMADDRSAAFWTSVATTFKNDRAIMFDAFNEPYSRYYDDGPNILLDWACWRDGGCSAPQQNDETGPYDGRTFAVTGMRTLVAAIRATGARQPILLGGLDYANDLRGWLAARPADGQLIASFHNYRSQRCSTVACWNAEIAPVAARVPVITGEFGETDCRESFDREYMDWADAHRVGYLAWQWVVLAPDERPTPPCSSLALITDVRGTPGAPNGTALKSHLKRFADGAPGTPRMTGIDLRAARGGLTLRVTLSKPATVHMVTRRPGGRTTIVNRSLPRGGHSIRLISRAASGRYTVGLRAIDGSGRRSTQRTVIATVR